MEGNPEWFEKVCRGLEETKANKEAKKQNSERDSTIKGEGHE